MSKPRVNSSSVFSGTCCPERGSLFPHQLFLVFSELQHWTMKLSQSSSLLLLCAVCLIGTAFGNMCDFTLDLDGIQSSVFDTNTPALVAFTRDEEDDSAARELMERAVESLGELGFCVSTFDCSDSKHAKVCSITAGNYPLLSLYLGEPKKNPYTKKVSVIVILISKCLSYDYFHWFVC